MKKYILSIDQGTTSTRAILFDKKGAMVAVAQHEVSCSFPFSGWVEQDALDIWLSVIDVINEVLIKTNETFASIDAIGITNQRETTVVWDKNSGMPVYKAIVWQSRQSQEICEKYTPYKDLIHQKTGLLINPYFSASKIRFILDHIENGQERAEKGTLMFGTIDSWIIYKLSSGALHLTDVSNASRTMLFNINTLTWDEELLHLFNIPLSILPKVKPSSSLFGNATYFSCDLPIAGVAGDQQAALFGQACYEKGDLKNTYGTGCFLLMNTGSQPIYSKKGLLTTIAWSLNNEVTYALEGSVFVAGAAVQWLRDQMKMISNAADSEKAAYKADEDNPIFVVPAFVGLGTPYWDDNARGSVFNMTRATTKYDFIKATLDAIAYQSRDVIEVMKEETKLDLPSLKVDGGATSNQYLMQTQADLLNIKLLMPKCLETTALGAAYLAGLATGFWKSINEIKSIHQYQKEYVPNDNYLKMEKQYQMWKVAVNATRMFKF